MSMATKYSELRAMTTEELVRRYDELATHVDLGLDFYRQEIWRRDQERQTQTMLTLTWVIAALTLVNTIAVVVALRMNTRRQS